MPTKDEQDAALVALETPEERAEREAAGLDKPRRGRPPGSSNRPKLSDEALTLGCKQLVSLLWLLCRFPAYLVDRTLTPLSDAEKTEGAEQAKALVAKYGFLTFLLTVIGFPLWLITKVIEHAEKITHKDGAEKKTPLIQLAPAPENTEAQPR